MSILQRTYNIKGTDFSEQELRELYDELHKIYDDTTKVSDPIEWPIFSPSYNPTPSPFEYPGYKYNMYPSTCDLCGNE